MDVSDNEIEAAMLAAIIYRSLRPLRSPAG